MPAPQKALRMDRSTAGLRQCQHHRPDQRQPQIARPADDRRLKREQQLRATGIAIKGAAQAQRHARQGHRHHGQRRRNRRRAPRIDADQPCRHRVLRRGPDAPPQCGARQQHVQRADDDDCRPQYPERHDAQIDPKGQLIRRPGQIADIGGQRPGIRAKLLKHHVVQHNGQAKGGQDRQQFAAARAAIQQQALQGPAQRRHRQHQQQRPGKG